MNDRPFAHRRVIAAALLALLASTGALAQEPAPRAATETAVRIVPDDLFHVEFVGEGRAWITGYHGTVLRSDDAGASWTNVSLDSHQLLRRGAFPSREHAWLVGHRGSIFHSADGGETWVRSHHEPGIYLRDIAFLDERRGWAVGHEGTILHTRDGGQGWHKQPLSDWTRRDLPRLSGIAIVDAQRLVATGEFGTLAYTQDGGQTWRHIALPGEPTMTAIAAAAGQVLAVGLDGAMASATFAGGQFAAQALPTTIPTHLLDVRMTRAGTLISGFGVVVRCAALDSCGLMPTAENFPSQFLWLAGVDVADDGAIWTVGLGGHVGRAADAAAPIHTRFVLGQPGWQQAQAQAPASPAGVR